MTHLPEVRAAVVKAVPEIMELKYRCVISEATGMGEQRQQKTVLAYAHMLRGSDGAASYDRLITYSGSGFEDRRADAVHFKVLGRPIRLADVLRAIDSMNRPTAEAIDQSGWFWMLGESLSPPEPTGYRWNLAADSLDEQSEETIAFLHSILCV